MLDLSNPIARVDETPNGAEKRRTSQQNADLKFKIEVTCLAKGGNESLQVGD